MSKERDNALADFNRAAARLKAVDEAEARKVLRDDSPPHLEFPRLVFKVGEEPKRIEAGPEAEAQRAAALADGWFATQFEADEAAKPKPPKPEKPAKPSKKDDDKE